LKGNYVVGGTTEAVDITYWQNLQFRNNTLIETGRVLAFWRPEHRGVWVVREYALPGSGGERVALRWDRLPVQRLAPGDGARRTDQVIATNSHGAGDILRPNKYEPGRANIICVQLGASAFSPG